jgi:hypothetical protein
MTALTTSYHRSHPHPASALLRTPRFQQRLASRLCCPVGHPVPALAAEGRAAVAAHSLSSVLHLEVEVLIKESRSCSMVSTPGRIRREPVGPTMPCAIWTHTKARSRMLLGEPGSLLTPPRSSLAVLPAPSPSLVPVCSFLLPPITP